NLVLVETEVRIASSFGKRRRPLLEESVKAGKHKGTGGISNFAGSAGYSFQCDPALERVVSLDKAHVVKQTQRVDIAATLNLRSSLVKRVEHYYRGRLTHGIDRSTRPTCLKVKIVDDICGQKSAI